MDNRFLYIRLYDEYGPLFTEKQQSYFEDYYLENLTLAEIAENHGISRNAVHKQLKDMEERLMIDEEKLKHIQFRSDLLLLIDQIEDDHLKEKIKNLF